MPLMREWTEIAVDEELLVPVVRELLDMAVNPNQVEIVHGTHGRVILAEVHLAEHWYQERLKRDTEEVVAPADKVAAPAEVAPPVKTVTPAPTPAPVVMPMKVEPSKVAAAGVLPVPPPVKRVSAPKPSASLDGEEQ